MAHGLHFCALALSLSLVTVQLHCLLAASPLLKDCQDLSSPRAFAQRSSHAHLGLSRAHSPSQADQTLHDCSHKLDLDFYYPLDHLSPPKGPVLNGHSLSFSIESNWAEGRGII